MLHLTNPMIMIFMRIKSAMEDVYRIKKHSRRQLQLIFNGQKVIIQAKMVLNQTNVIKKIIYLCTKEKTFHLLLFDNIFLLIFIH